MKVRKAVIAVAGLGTRFLPATKSVPKEMLPIVDRPIVQHLVEELVASGITDILFITNPNPKILKDHFSPNPTLTRRLKQQGKTQLARNLDKISRLASFSYLAQTPGYGNALPAITARRWINDEPFIYVFGDDLVKSQRPFTKQLIATYQKHGCSVLGVQEVSSNDTSKYGIVKLRGKTRFIEDIVEKPSPKSAPSRLAVFGRYLFTPDIFNALSQTNPGKNGEVWIADAISILARTQPVITEPVRHGSWLTTGDPASYLKAVITYSKSNPRSKTSN